MDKAENQAVDVEPLQENWSEQVEDLVAADEIDKGISLLESLVSKLEINSSSTSSLYSELQLASALSELGKLYSAKGLSLKADEIESRAYLIKQRVSNVRPSVVLDSDKKSEEVPFLTVDSSAGDKTHSEASNHGHFEEEKKDLQSGTSAGDDSLDDDWEALADLEPTELLPSKCLPAIPQIKSEDANSLTPKRRGRGTFTYDKLELYSDHLTDDEVVDLRDEDDTHDFERNADLGNTKYGTRHALVLAHFSPRTTTIELEELFKDFKHHGFAIRWINDTTALAVFPTPSIALDACSRIKCLFSVRLLEEDDTLLRIIKVGDLEPPRPRPQTSVRAAQRLIAQGMGLKVPSSSSFGSRELKKQEDARRNRIVDRQKLRDEAWGDDDDDAN